MTIYYAYRASKIISKKRMNESCVDIKIGH